MTWVLPIKLAPGKGSLGVVRHPVQHASPVHQSVLRMTDRTFPQVPAAACAGFEP